VSRVIGSAARAIMGMSARVSDQLVRSLRVPPKHPVEKLRSVASLLTFVLVSNAESVRDLKQCSLVLAQQLCLQQLAAIFKHSCESDDRGPLVVLSRPMLTKECERVPHLVY